MAAAAGTGRRSDHDIANRTVLHSRADLDNRSGKVAPERYREHARLCQRLVNGCLLKGDVGGAQRCCRNIDQHIGWSDGWRIDVCKLRRLAKCLEPQRLHGRPTT